MTAEEGDDGDGNSTGEGQTGRQEARMSRGETGGGEAAFFVIGGGARRSCSERRETMPR